MKWFNKYKLGSCDPARVKSNSENGFHFNCQLKVFGKLYSALTQVDTTNVTTVLWYTVLKVAPKWSFGEFSLDVFILKYSTASYTVALKGSNMV